MKFLQNMKFKMTPELTFVLVAFVVVIVFANYGSCCGGPKPYEFDNLFPKYSKFEGFENDDMDGLEEDGEDILDEIEEDLEDEAVEEMTTKKPENKLLKDIGLERLKPAESFVTIGASVNKVDTMGGLTKPGPVAKDNVKEADSEGNISLLDSVKTFAMGLFSSKPSDKETQESFSAMSPSSLDKAYDIVDQVGQLSANAECIGKSHGYTTSSGGVCWTKETEKLLLTRGGQKIEKGEKL